MFRCGSFEFTIILFGESRGHDRFFYAITASPNAESGPSIHLETSVRRVAILAHKRSRPTRKPESFGTRRNRLGARIRRSVDMTHEERASCKTRVYTIKRGSQEGRTRNACHSLERINFIQMAISVERRIRQSRDFSPYYAMCAL